MTNLLNEEEFIKPKAYKPWKWFLLWYGLMLLLTTFFLIINGNLADNFDELAYNIISYSFTAIKLSFPFLMIFGKKENIMLPYSTLLLALLGMYIITIVYLITVTFLLYGGFDMDFFINFILKGYLYDFLVYKIPTIIIIFLIVIYKRKKALKRAI